MNTEIKFEHGIGEVVYNKPSEITTVGSPSYVQYAVVSRIYEEIGKNGNGVVSYVVRHIDPTVAGGGKLYKFAQDELIDKGGLDTLMEIKRKAAKEESLRNVGGMGGYSAIPNYMYGAVTSGSTGGNIP
jgi:hypothetical protein